MSAHYNSWYEVIWTFLSLLIPLPLVCPPFLAFSSRPASRPSAKAKSSDTLPPQPGRARKSRYPLRPPHRGSININGLHCATALTLPYHDDNLLQAVETFGFRRRLTCLMFWTLLITADKQLEVFIVISRDLKYRSFGNPKSGLDDFSEDK